MEAEQHFDANLAHDYVVENLDFDLEILGFDLENLDYESLDFDSQNSHGNFLDLDDYENSLDLDENFPGFEILDCLDFDLENSD